MAYGVGAIVFDLVSRRKAEIVDCKLSHAGTSKFTGFLVYTLDDSVPLDPTGDGAFPTRHRLATEICNVRDRVRQHKDFTY